jgi:hypothetical protein
MIYKMFSVHDVKSEVYSTPYCFKATGEAVRWFSDSSNDEKSTLNKHPEDFTLFELGEYDDSSCNYTPLPTPVPLGKALDYIRS